MGPYLITRAYFKCKVSKPQTIELLSPARNIECGFAAINAGADAVYIGGDKFSARSQAGNSLGDISNLIQYAHKYYAKVYAAVNTIFTDQELHEASRLIHGLYEEGIDGIIVQDMGLLETDLPPVPLIASTQMHNNTVEKVLFLEKIGFSRAILPRELTLDEIKAIRSKTTIELETFIHGALCVSYSGQCYMSYSMGGRSGNRGVCAQPCRKYYSLIDDKGAILKSGYLLSLKDLNLSDHIGDLLNAGVSSFKIEGRLKDTDYVMNVTAHYRKLIDAIIGNGKHRKSSSGKTTFDFTPDPIKSFSRGFTTYFINGRDPDMASHGSPQSIGEYIGRIHTLNARSFTIDNYKEMNSGDGICFFDKEGQLKGTQIFMARDKEFFFETNEGLWVGAKVYRNYDNSFNKKLKGSRISRKIGVQMELEGGVDGLILSLKDEDDICVKNRSTMLFEPAKDPEQSLITIKKQISRLGETEFEALSLEINLSTIPFVPVKDLNSFRRDTIDLLRKERLLKYPANIIEHKPNNALYPQKKLNYNANVLNSNAKKFYKQHGVTEIHDAVEKGRVNKNTILMKTRYCLFHDLGKCDNGKNKVEGYFLSDDKGRKFRIRTDCSMCEMEILPPE